MTLIERAAAFAAKAHANHRRKYTNAPYVTHLAAVAAAVEAAGGDEAMIAAAWLHDTLEDTETTAAELDAEFGHDVTGLVVELTNVFTSKRFPKVNRAARKAMERKRLAGVSMRAKRIKLADIEDNTGSIVEHDPKFAAVYLKEKAALLRVFGSALVACAGVRVRPKRGAKTRISGAARRRG